MAGVVWTGEGWAKDVIPDHYRGGADGELQPWDVIDAFQLDFYKGNAMKYILRSGKKGDLVSDLRKAQHYLQYLIDRESEPDEPEPSPMDRARAAAQKIIDVKGYDEDDFDFEMRSTGRRLRENLQRWHNQGGESA